MRPFLLGFALSLLALSPLHGEEPKKEDYGYSVGKRMPNHVADFLLPDKPGKHSCGCPVVMVANTGGPGVIIWSRDVDASAFQLAKALDTNLSAHENFRRFLVVFTDNDKALAEKSASLKQVLVGKARGGAKELQNKTEIDSKAQVLVFFLQKEKIVSAWSFQAKELSEAKIKELSAAAQKHAESKK